MSIEEIRDFQKKTQVDLKIFKNNLTFLKKICYILQQKMINGYFLDR
jgi:hypothetical protein